jgi:sialate O-acetylesterase
MKNRLITTLTVFLFTVVASIPLLTKAKVKLPRIFTSNMVLQRDKPISLWGWGSPGEKISILFRQQTYTVVTAADGKWQVAIRPTSAGGPYQLKINDILLDNILIGDVWLCSGQSNMAFLLMNSEGAEETIKAAENDKIRLFTVKRNVDFNEVEDLDSTTAWQLCNQQTVKKFSAVAYYMAKRLQKDLNVPIGIVHSSYGGTVIEGFISTETIGRVDRLKPILAEVKGMNKEQFINSRIDGFKKKYGEMNPYAHEEVLWDTINPVLPKPAAEWAVMKLPVLWEKAGLPNVDGVIWFNKEIILSKEDCQNAAFLSLGRIADQSVTFFNGQKLGSSPDSRDLIRDYQVPVTMLREGRNQIMVRVANKGRNGGIWGPASKLYFQTGKGKKILIDGDWQFKVQDIKVAVHPNDVPASIYNAMIAPVKSLTFKGVVWYQGESNANWANEYATLLEMLIKDWRANFKQPDLPFLVVQLPNYKKVTELPEVNSTWALLREAQENSTKLPEVGLVVTIDLGVEDNIHPIFKAPVGERMALKALQQVYQMKVVADGPVFKDMKVDGNKALISFNSADGLKLDKTAKRTNFLIAGADKIFLWAKARIEGETIVLWNENIAHPLAVRYAWADNPGDNYLVNGAGLPARPFRTDNWPIVLEEIPR